MANEKIFCNVPWTNVHMYWDGSFGVCCSEKEKFVTDEKYNIKNMQMGDWYKSTAMTEVRNQLSGDNKLSPCRGCYREEQFGYESRRIKENFKSVIFTEAAFERSYLQSPWVDKFESRTADPHPIDWHIDFGNECNLACKMCHAGASSTIAAHLRRSGSHTGPVKTSWSDDPAAWNNFLASVDAAPIKRIHVMGGEPMLIKRYKEFIDYLVDNKRFEISLSFVTNGTVIDQELLDKLKQFANVDIEISIESIHDNNDYIRQGSRIADLLSNIKLVEQNQDEKLQLILRTVPQLLNIHTYADLIEFAWEHKLVIQGIPLIRPDFLAIRVLPWEMRQELVPVFQSLADRISSDITFSRLRTGRGIGTLADTLSKEAASMASMLKDPEPENVESLRKELVKHLQFWDRIYKLDAREYVPDLSDWLQEIGYAI
jgi:sulfatase maturation enzyme AslB (radical SAM superfamily)